MPSRGPDSGTSYRRTPNVGVVTGPDRDAESPQDPVSGHAEQSEPLAESDASAIRIDPTDPLRAPGPLPTEAKLEPAAPVIHADPAAAAFFDLDNTVTQGASLYHLAMGFYRRGFFPARVIVKAIWLQTCFRLAGENPSHIEDARNAVLDFIRGHTVAEVEEIAVEVYEQAIAPRIWPGTRALAQLHLDAGQQVWLVTATPVEVAGVIAARLGMTGALGTTADHVDGVYTGRLRGGLLHGPAKAEAVRALAHEHGLDLARCFAYSDSYNDLPMLSLVGHPCAINPDPLLLAHAEEQDWQIRDYRTGRRVARIGLLGAAGAGATAGAVATGLAIRRRLRQSISPKTKNAHSIAANPEFRGVSRLRAQSSAPFSFRRSGVRCD
jgi:HAD superfamily hydrolase (TIGR01490 family)